MTDDRTERLRRRFDEAQSGGRTGRDDPGGGSDGGDAGDSVRDRPSVLMYLPPELREELDVRYDELNAEHRREHGEPLGKNRDYYPAVVRAGLTGEPVEELLDL